MMTYKGYTARVEFDDEAMIFHGEVSSIRDVVTFQGKSVDEIEQAFHDSVDDYLAFCKERGEEPAKAFSGRLVLRITADTHRKIHMAAKRSGESVNSWLNKSLQRAL